jgi:hypothetical protein
MSRLVFGLQSVREVVRAHGDRVEKLLVEHRAGPKIDALARFAEGRGIPVEAVGRAELDRRAAGGRHQGVLALAPDLALVAVGSLDVQPGSVFVALDGVMDPQNFGAVIRSAVALGAGAIVWRSTRRRRSRRRRSGPRRARSSTPSSAGSPRCPTRSKRSAPVASLPSPSTRRGRSSSARSTCAVRSPSSSAPRTRGRAAPCAAPAATRRGCPWPGPSHR